ncbi:unnamed protein product [Mytilus coruscus]|uniref:B box-type domain-containing protein n=1 Tax=Mytilus coruscus TaxID=42192 RepID=A0A6J8CYY2_MYTCO|nr:unnamed protein product [Mytilus coruscus]
MESSAVKCRSVLNYLKFHGSEHFGREESRGEKSSVNYALRKWTSLNNNDVIRCECCTEKDTAIGYCKTCPGFIDQSCLGFHQRILNWSTHKYFIFTDREDLQITDFAPESVCQIKKHDNVVADAYCRKCRVVACSKCIKRHKRKCNTINSLQEWYHLLQAVIKTKHMVKNLIRRIPRGRNDEKLIVLSTIVIWIDQTLGIDSYTIPYSPIKERLERAASTENQTYYIASNTVVDKFYEIQQDLNREFHRSLQLNVIDDVPNEVHRQTVEQHYRHNRFTEDTTNLKKTINSNQIDDQIEEEYVSTEESSSSDEKSNSERGLGQQTNQMHMTVTYPIDNMDERRFQQVSDDIGEDSMENNVPIEKDIKILQEARLNTFKSVHSGE